MIELDVPASSLAHTKRSEQRVKIDRRAGKVSGGESVSTGSGLLPSPIARVSIVLAVTETSPSLARIKRTQSSRPSRHR